MSSYLSSPPLRPYYDQEQLYLYIAISIASRGAYHPFLPSLSPSLPFHLTLNPIHLRDFNININTFIPCRRYHVSTTLSSRVGALNPGWNEEQTPEIMNERFKEAMALTCSEFVSHAQSLSQSWWPARSIVQV
jgi:Uncharacterised protein family (UPF0160)